MSKISDYNQDEYDSYLDGLRESGVTNMFGAGSYMEGIFGLSEKDAGTVLSSWMKAPRDGEGNVDRSLE